MGAIPCLFAEKKMLSCQQKIRKRKSHATKRGFFKNLLIQLSAMFFVGLKQKEFLYVRYNDG